MKQHTTPQATTTAATVHITSGQILWVCLPPGSTLHTIRGEATVRSTPSACGHAVHSPPQAILKAGAPWPLPKHDQATWVQLGSATRGPAEVHIVENTPEPGPLRRAWALLRTNFAGHKKEQPDGAYGAWHAAR